MSTDWIKLRVDLRTHPKVVRMASALRADKLRVIGGLFAVWSIFDAHSSDGILEGYTFRAVDEELGWKGFAVAMGGIDWLVEHPEGLETPRFDEHNGQSAKRRAMETERKRIEREIEKAALEAAKAATEAGQVSASNADKSVTREEKRREEEKKGARKRPPSFDAGKVELPEWLDRRLWADWCDDRAERGKRITARGAGQQLVTLDEFRKQGHSPERVIRHAIASGNQGLFPPPRLNGVVQAITVPSNAADETAAYLRKEAEHAAAVKAERLRKQPA